MKCMMTDSAGELEYFVVDTDEDAEFVLSSSS